MNKLLILALIAVLGGCGVVSTVEESDESATINTLLMGCNSPYNLEQDCSMWSGATRKLIIDGFEVKVGATKSGKVILVMDSKLFSISPYELYLLNRPSHSIATNNSFVVVKKILSKNQIKINRVRALKSLGNVDGYVLELDSDGYSILKKFSAE